MKPSEEVVYLKVLVNLCKTMEHCDFGQITISELRHARILSAKAYGALISSHHAEPSTTLNTLASLDWKHRITGFGGKTRQEVYDILKAAGLQL
jgi:hypothetical protein